MMYFVSFHINRTERSGRAEVLTSATAYALVLVHGRHLHRAVWTFVVYHLDGSRRAMAGAIAATDAVGQHNAVFLDPHSMTYMDAGLFLACDGLDGTSRADLAATGTFGTAVAALKRHRRLHKM